MNENPNQLGHQSYPSNGVILIIFVNIDILSFYDHFCFALFLFWDVQALFSWHRTLYSAYNIMSISSRNVS